MKAVKRVVSLADALKCIFTEVSIIITLLAIISYFSHHLIWPSLHGLLWEKDRQSRPYHITSLRTDLLVDESSLTRVVVVDINSYPTSHHLALLSDWIMHSSATSQGKMNTNRTKIYICIYIYLTQYHWYLRRNSAVLDRPIQIKFGRCPASYIFDHWSAVKNRETKWWIPDLPQSLTLN